MKWMKGGQVINDDLMESSEFYTVIPFEFQCFEGLLLCSNTLISFTHVEYYMLHAISVLV